LAADSPAAYAYVSSGTSKVPVLTVRPAKSASVSIRQLPPARISLGRNFALYAIFRLSGTQYPK
jgi:hypothetical protein